MSDLLPQATIRSMTGYKRPADQLRELHRQGFWRARRAQVTGEVILERPHYEAVMAGSARNEPPVDITPVLRGLTQKRPPAAPMDWNARTALYRHFDKKGALLYVGIAVDPQKRESSHRCYSEWRDRIHRIDVEWFESRHAAVAAERAAIAAGRPKFNILHQARKTPA